MDDDGPANDGVLAEERNVLVGDVERDGAVAVRLDVAEVTDVSLGCVRSTVLGSRGLLGWCAEGEAVRVSPGSLYRNKPVDGSVRTLK